MTLRRIRTIPYFLLALCAGSRLASAQTAHWTAPLRGSWVQTGPTAQGDVILAGKDHASEVVVGDDENPAVHQAAEFLAGDIQKISGVRPPVVKTPGGDRVSIRLVTLGHGQVPAAIDAAAMQGQWESYRIVTAGPEIRMGCPCRHQLTRVEPYCRRGHQGTITASGSPRRGTP